MDESVELCSLPSKFDEQQETRVSETEQKDRQKGAIVSETEENDRQKVAIVSETEEKDRQREARVSETEENDMQKEIVVETEKRDIDMQKVVKVRQTEEKISTVEEKVKQTEENEKVKHTEEKDKTKVVNVSQTDDEKISETEDKVSEKKAKVTFKFDLGDNGEDSSTCSDRSFDVNTDSTETSAQSDGHAVMKIRKKGKRRGCKGGIRHKKREHYERCRDNYMSQHLSQRALHLQEKDHAAAVSRFSDEQHLMLYPSAPFNSTQFLMEDQYKNSPQEDTDKWLVSSASNSPEHQISTMPLSPSETNHEEIHFPKRDQEFTDSLNSIQAESLQSLPKEELVKHFMHLEEKVAALHKQVTEAELEQKQEQDDDEDVYSQEGKHVQKPYVYESVYNSETNSLSSNNEEFLDLSRVNQLPVCVEESSVFVSDNTVSSTIISSSESSS